MMRNVVGKRIPSIVQDARPLLTRGSTIVPQTEPIVGVHLDLKYAMPRKTFLTDWVRRLPALGINTLLLEYEDKFPFQRHPFLRSPDAFTPEELRLFLRAAREVGLRVIPLVQTFAHLEFALAHERLAHLRELPHVHAQINPANPEAVAFVEGLVDEVLACHAEDEFVHLGADEAWHMGHNPDNAPRFKELGPTRYWAWHVGRIIERVMVAGKRPMVWDDVFWSAPQALAELRLPRELVLVSWNYTNTRGDDAAVNDRVQAYQAAGHQVVGAPCLNWGVLTPRHDHCLDNTRAWADVCRRQRLMGVINTAWACFHVLPHAQDLYIAATARAVTAGPETIDRAWQTSFLSDYYAADADGIPQALEAIGSNWGHRLVGVRRPITPILFSYTDMVVGYPNGQADRVNRGAYPLIWAETDFDALFDRKMRMLRESARPAEIEEKLCSLQELFDRARDVLRPFLEKVTRRRDEARYQVLTAETKALHARVVSHLVRGEGSRADLLAAWRSLGPRLADALRPFVEEAAGARLMRLWWQPTAAALASGG